MMNGLKLLLAAFAIVASLNTHAVAAPPQNGDADGLMRTCATLYQQRRFEEALTPCVKAATLKPDDYRVHALTGYVYLAQMNPKKASDSFATAIKLRPQDKELYLLKATADLYRNASDEAAAAARKALEIDPDWAEAYVMLGDAIRWDEKRRDEAVAAYRAAIKRDPALREPYAALGQILAHAKDEKGAEEVFRQGMAADPKHMAGRFELGRMLVEQGRLADARELWEGRTSDEDTTFPNFITVLERAENLKRATEALAARPEDPEALLSMGLAVMDGDSWVVDGRQERAIVYFRKVLSIKPGYAKAQYAICKAYIQIADTYAKEKPHVDQELAKLRRLDPKLADEMEAYRKSYSGGLRAVPVQVDK